jgi:hypothetical protein
MPDDPIKLRLAIPLSLLAPSAHFCGPLAFFGLVHSPIRA